MPVIFVTSTDKLEVMRECVEAGGDDFMVKDADIKGYLERVGYWMGGAASPRPSVRRP